MFKAELAALAATIGLVITVCHMPPGTLKWNKIEHRLFSFISMNWRGRPLTTYRAEHDAVAPPLDLRLGEQAVALDGPLEQQPKGARLGQVVHRRASELIGFVQARPIDRGQPRQRPLEGAV